MRRLAQMITVAIAVVGCSPHHANNAVDGPSIDAYDAASSDTASNDAATADAAPLPYGLELLAGTLGGTGNGNGTGPTARFLTPMGMAFDSAGNLYVSEPSNSDIRKITPAGVVTTFAGVSGVRGSRDGTGAEARFTFPAGLVFDAADNLYVTDRGDFTIRKITPAGVVTTLAGTPGMAGSTDGTGAAARFVQPFFLAIDSAGTLYMSDDESCTIRTITPAGVVTTLAGQPGVHATVDGTGAAARFNRPGGIAIDAAGDIFVTDDASTIRKVTAAGVVTTVAGAPDQRGSADGPAAEARFDTPVGVAFNRAGDLYIVDAANRTIRKLSSAGAVTTVAGTPLVVGSADGAGPAASFFIPAGVAIASTGDVYIADEGNFTIRKMTPGGEVTTFAGAPALPGSVDGTGAAARFNLPGSVAADGAGNVYVADASNQTIRMITGAGVTTTLAGAVGMTGSADGTGAQARFFSPSSVTADSRGTVYVADTFNHTIRKISGGGVVTTLAGTALASGSTDGTGAEARFNFPVAVAVDSAGNVYVADSGNNAIRKVTTAGVATTVVAADPHFSFLVAIAVDGAGNLYVTDGNNHTISKVSPGGAVTTLAGTANMPGSADGIGSAARFNQPIGVAVDSAGNVYVADHGNATIRKITPDGTTTTIAGTAGVTGIVLGATPRFASPTGLSIDGDSLVITDGNAVLLLRHGISP